MSTLNFKKDENKKLVNTLNRKMFRGFLKIKKLKEIKEYKKNNKFTKIVSPINQWKEYVPLPFEDNYNITYESRFLQKLNNNNKIKNPFEIKNIKPYTAHSLEKKNVDNKIFLTNNINNNNNLNKTQSSSNSNNQKTFYNTYSRNQMDLISKIFPEKNELTKFTNLPFFSLTKNPNLQDLNNNKNLFKSKTDKEKKLIEEDFIYKLSHKKEFQTDNNFYLDKVKKGNTMNYFPNNKILNSNNNKLQLNIKNLKTNQRVSQLNPEERHLQRIEKNLLELKTLPGELFADLTNNLWNDDYDENLFDKKLNEKLEKGINEKEEKFINLNDVLDLLNNNKKRYNNNYINFYDPKIYKYNNYDYMSQQLKNKQERFQFIHKLAFEEFKSRRNTKPINFNYSQNVKSYISPHSNLLSKKKTTNKTLYDKESKIRDMLIGNKLKCEYNKDDIERVLNGISPWKSIKEKYEQ